ncbi:MAG: calcium-binding protein, partial [Sulfuritalea sp.]|nr:calcium-binding protein [Sulfuritalea sp.]
ITGNSGNNILDGGTNTGSLIDTLVGGLGDDIYIVDSTTDIITELATADSGTDTVQSSVTFSLVDTDGSGANGGNIENLTLTGGTAAINGTGNSAANTITGNSGNNTLIGGLGSDTLIGGGGNDTAAYSSSASGVTVSLVTGSGSGGDAQGDTLSGIQNITGSALSDTLTGDANANTLIGGDGADSLIGGAGNDTLDLKTNTTATAFAIDSADGGTGDDTVIVSQSSLGGLLNGGADSDTLVVYGSANATLNISSLNAQNFEKLDVKADSNATTVVLSSAAISNLVNATGADTLTLRLGSEDSYSIAAESGVTFTQGQSIKFFNSSNPLIVIAQVDFNYG